MNVFKIILLLFLIVCAVACSFQKSLLRVIVVFMVYSVVMSVLWAILESPDLAVTEAAVGAGITTLLFFVALKKLERIGSGSEKEEITEEDDNDDE